MVEFVRNPAPWRLLLGLWLVLALLGAGCARKAPPPPPSSAPPVASNTVKPFLVKKLEQATLYDEGVKAYDAGDLKRAAAVFQEAYAVETDPAVRQRSLFALAAQKLAQAGSDTELATALDLLDTWAKASPAGGSGEDPRFVLPAVRLYKPPFVVKDVKAAADKECAKKILEKEEGVKQLIQQQVKALERIHREIQEKKKGLTTY